MKTINIIESGRFQKSKLTKQKMTIVKGGICLCDKKFGGSGKNCSSAVSMEPTLQCSSKQSFDLQE